MIERISRPKYDDFEVYNTSDGVGHLVRFNSNEHVYRELGRERIRAGWSSDVTPIEFVRIIDGIYDMPRDSDSFSAIANAPDGDTFYHIGTIGQLYDYLLDTDEEVRYIQYSRDQRRVSWKMPALRFDSSDKLLSEVCLMVSMTGQNEVATLVGSTGSPSVNYDALPYIDTDQIARSNQSKLYPERVNPSTTSGSRDFHSL